MKRAWGRRASVVSVGGRSSIIFAQLGPTRNRSLPSQITSFSSPFLLLSDPPTNSYQCRFLAHEASPAAFDDELKSVIERLAAGKWEKSDEDRLDKVTEGLGKLSDLALLDNLAAALDGKVAALKASRLEKILEMFQSNQGQKAVALADSIRETEGFVPGYTLFSSMAKIYAKNNRLPTTRRVISDMIIEGCPPLAISDATEIIQYANAPEDKDLLKQLWKLYSTNQIVGDIEFYDGLMKAGLRIRAPALTAYFFRQTELVRWTSSSYASYMGALGQLNRVDLVKRWLVRLRNRGTTVDATVLNGHIHGLAAGGELELALDKLKAMEKGQLPAVNKETYQAYIEGCTFRGEVEQAWGGLRKMEAKGFQPTTEDYNTIIQGCLKVEKLRDIDEALTRMTNAGLSPNLQTYNLVLRVCISQKDVLKAEKVLASLTKMGLTPDADTYHGIIEACGAYAKALADGDPYNPALLADTKKLVAKAQGYFEEMVERGITPRAETMYVLLKFTITSKDFKKATRYYKRLRRMGYRLTPEIVAAMSHATYDAMVSKNLV